MFALAAHLDDLEPLNSASPNASYRASRALLFAPTTVHNLTAPAQPDRYGLACWGISMTFAVAIAIVSLLVAIAWGIARYRRRSRQIREEQRRHWEVHERARATEGGINLRKAKIIDRLYVPEAVLESAQKRAQKKA
jgi:hypothetical protein